MSTLNVERNRGQVAHQIINQASPCLGPDACPYRRSSVPQSLQEEAEFYRLAGFRTGAHEQKLLDEFRRRHRLNWRGMKSIERMWRHRTLEYDVDSDSLRLNPSLFVLAAGWTYFGLSALTATFMSLAATHEKAFNGDAWAIAGGVGVFFIALASIWLSIEHMVAPELLSRRLAKKEREAAQAQ